MTPLKEARKRLGMGLVELAARVDSDDGNLSRIERRLQYPSRELAERLVHAIKDEARKQRKRITITELHLLYPERFAA